jgi:predicted nucleic acid-binding Zn ribbon protein
LELPVANRSLPAAYCLLLIMQSLQQFLPGVVAEIVRRAPMSRDKVAFAWQATVGPAIARATVIALGDGGVLDVQVSTEAWRKELKRSASVILERLEKFLGPGVIARLKIAASHPEVRGHGRRRVTHRRATSPREAAGAGATRKVAASRTRARPRAKR